jgi:hypothetical protein
MSFGVNDVHIFQGVQNGVTHQIQNKFIPHLEGSHYMAHRTNLVVQTKKRLLATKLLVKEKYVTTKKGGDQKCWHPKLWQWKIYGDQKRWQLKLW